MTVLDRFAPATRRWFEGTFATPTPAQSQAWEAIADGDHTLTLHRSMFDMGLTGGGITNPDDVAGVIYGAAVLGAALTQYAG